MSSSSHSLSPAPAASAPPFHWLNPLQPTKFRVIVGVGIGIVALLLINLFTPGPLGALAYLLTAVIAVASYLLAEVLVVLLVSVGPFIGFLYGVYACFWR